MYVCKYAIVGDATEEVTAEKRTNVITKVGKTKYLLPQNMADSMV